MLPFILPFYMSANSIHDLGVLMTQATSSRPQLFNTAALGVKLQYFSMSCILDSKLKLYWPIRLESSLLWVLNTAACLL